MTTAAKTIGIADIMQAAKVIAPLVIRTPLQFSQALSTLYGANIWFKAQLFSQQMATDFGLVTNACSSVKAACKQAQILITTTASTSPLVTLNDLPAGIHITAIGSDNSHKRELDKHLVTSADLLVVDQITQSKTMGELKQIPIDSLTILTLGKLIAQQHYPRSNHQQISLCDLTGTGVQDTAIACYAAQCLELH